MNISTYTKEIEEQMLNFYKSLSEKDRRRYAAIEATKLGYGGDSYICRLLHCNDRTITRGQKELLTDLSNENSRIRKVGAGRKFVIDECKSPYFCESSFWASQPKFAAKA